MASGYEKKQRKSGASSVRVCLRVLDGVFSFLQLGDVQLRLSSVQTFEPHLVVVNGGDNGTETHIQQLIVTQI